MFYHYLTPEGRLLRTRKVATKSDTFIISVYSVERKKWDMPAFPEITKSELENYYFLGKVKEECSKF